ncbi:MAG: phosphotransferase family protein [Pirellulales bacterium]
MQSNINDPTKDFRARLGAFLGSEAGTYVEITAARRMAGGASRESWAVDVEIAGGPDAGRHALVLRLDSGGKIHDEALSRREEFHVLCVAHREGVMVPRPRWVCADPAVLGAPFLLMDRVEGESVGRRIVRQPELAEAHRRLPAQLGRQLARIHAIDPQEAGLDFLPARNPGRSFADTALDRAAAQLWRMGEPHPALELALRWLQAHAPTSDSAVLVHGDFRIGNVIVGPEGLRAVLDWEFAHVGDPAEDLAWPSVRSWRFGVNENRFGGIGEPEEFYAAYEQAGGRPVDRGAVDYWEILGNLRWAVGCMAQAHRHLSGQQQSVELASLGRRTAEMELEVLDLIQRARCAQPALKPTRSRQ